MLDPDSNVAWDRSEIDERLIAMQTKQQDEQAAMLDTLRDQIQTGITDAVENLKLETPFS